MCPAGCLFSVKKSGILNLYEPPHKKEQTMNVDPLQVLSKLAAVYNIPACRVTPPFAGLENFDYGLRKALDPEFDWQEFGYTLLKHRQ